MPPTRFPYLTKRDHKWFARLTVPHDVRHVIGHNMFSAPTGERDPTEAYTKAQPILAAWRRRIETARRTAQDPLQVEVQKLATEYRRLHGTQLDEAANLLVGDVLKFMFQRIGGLSRAQQRQALAEAGGDVAEAAQVLTNPGKALSAYDQVTRPSTPFLAHFEAWKAATHLKGKTKRSAVDAVEFFADTVRESLETLSRKHVKAWIEGSLRPHSGNARDPATVNRYLWGCRSYWTWMQGHELVSEESNPFSKQKVQGSKTKVEKAAEKRQRFEPLDVPRLWQAAEHKGDRQLADLIRLAAFTGARRESLAALKVHDIKRDRQTGIRCFHFADKSEAGVRPVPVHSAIDHVVTALVKGAESDGYLFYATTTNQDGDRGDAIGKRFTRLKQGMGFQERQTFHSIRHTVIYMFRKVGCDIELRNEIVGHESEHVGAKYGGVFDLGQKQEWLEKAIDYP